MTKVNAEKIEAGLLDALAMAAFERGAREMRARIACIFEDLGYPPSVVEDVLNSIPPPYQSSTQTGTSPTTGHSWKVQASRQPPRA